MRVVCPCCGATNSINYGAIQVMSPRADGLYSRALCLACSYDTQVQARWNWDRITMWPVPPDGFLAVDLGEPICS